MTSHTFIIGSYRANSFKGQNSDEIKERMKLEEDEDYGKYF